VTVAVASRANPARFASINLREILCQRVIPNSLAKAHLWQDCKYGETLPINQIFPKVLIR
jgi:hypothetical protein